MPLQANAQQMKKLAAYLCIGLCCSLPCLAENTPVLNIVTEEDPPYNYTDNTGQLNGIAIELVQLLLQKTGFSNTEIQVLPWGRAYTMALKKPNTLIFSMTRSARREQQFHWIGNIISHSVYLFQHRNRTDINLPHLAAVKQYRVGAVAQWDTTVWLTQKGIPILELEESWQGFKMMDLGKIDLVPDTELSLAYNAAQYNLDPSHFMKALKIRDTHTEFAMSKNSDPALVKKLQNAYKKIRSSKHYQRIYDKYVYLDLYDKPIADKLRK